VTPPLAATSAAVILEPIPPRPIPDFSPNTTSLPLPQTLEKGTQGKKIVVWYRATLPKCVCRYVYVYVCAYVCVYICGYVCVHIYVCMYVHILWYIYVYIHMYTQHTVCTQYEIYMHRCTYMYIYVHLCIHSCIFSDFLQAPQCYVPARGLEYDTWTKVYCSVLQCVAVCCSVLQCVAVCCSVLQCVAVWHVV